MKRIAIIGAGPAGLSAAYELIECGAEYEVVIFEKETEVGGLSKTYKFEGGRIDIGGHRFFTKNKKVQEFWEKILPFKEDGMLIRNRSSHILWNAKLIEYPIKLNINTLKALGGCKGAQVILSYFKTVFCRKNIYTLEDFYKQRFGEKLYQLFFRDYTHKLWGLPANQLSADWGEQRIHKISLMQLLTSALFSKNDERTKERSLIDKYQFPVLGAGQLWQAVAKYVAARGGSINLNCNVNKLCIKTLNVINIEYTCRGKQMTEKFDYVISSMPLSELIEAFDDVPINVREVARLLSYRDMIIVGLEFDCSEMGETYWMAEKDSWLYMQDSSVSFGRVQILNNWSPSAANDEAHILLELEYFCFKDDNLWQRSDEEFVQQALYELKKCKLCNENAIILSSIVKKIEKAYPIYNNGYYRLNEIREWLDSIVNIQCIGRNGQHRYNNMDHSVETGFIAARNIISGNTCKGQLWNVNTEKQNHEKCNK